MTKTPRKNVSDVGIELGAACMPSGLVSNQATPPDVETNLVDAELIKYTLVTICFHI